MVSLLGTAPAKGNASKNVEGVELRTVRLQKKYVNIIDRHQATGCNSSVT